MGKVFSGGERHTVISLNIDGSIDHTYRVDKNVPVSKMFVIFSTFADLRHPPNIIYVGYEAR